MTLRRPFIRSPRPRTMAWASVGLVLVATMVALGVSTLAWATTLQEEGRLLPGTTISTVDVGGTTQAEAIADVEEHLAARLDRSITITSGDERWQTTARELGAETDVTDVVGRAHRHASQAGTTALARVRWSSRGAGLALTAGLVLSDDTIDRLVAEVADRTDRDARDATVAWTGTTLEVTPDDPGVQIDGRATAEVLRTAITRGDASIQVPTRMRSPSVTTDAARQIAAVVDAALDRTITLEHQEASWEVTARDLDADPDLEPLTRAASTGTSLPDVTFSVPEDALADYLAEIDAEVHVSARDAQVELVGGAPRITPERPGLALDREAATQALRAAFNGQDQVVELPTTSSQPSVTAASLDERMLVVDQAERRVHLYRNGQAVRSWAVAVGSGDSPTPTGMFTVGTKRYEPTWHNPAPDRWGQDMPAKIGPGPDNPLGARALNWNRGGRDTLIRFHGTPNEASIGQAASKGCIRMYNADVVELYDLVPSGTPIVSIRN